MSHDGLVREVLPFTPPDADVEACHVPQPLITRKDGEDWLDLFDSTQLGRRRDDGTDQVEYDQIRAMRRPTKRARR